MRPGIAEMYVGKALLPAARTTDPAAATLRVRISPAARSPWSGPMIAALVAAVLFTAIGAPLLALAGIDRPALAPATGIAAAGVVLATAATVGLEIGPVALGIAAAVLIAIAMWQRGPRASRDPRCPC